MSRLHRFLAFVFLVAAARAGTGEPRRAAPAVTSLVDVSEIAPGVRLEMRYAGADNFLKKAVYPCARCLLRKETAEALARVQQSVAEKGLALKLWDCYRPPSVQEAMWKVVPDARFVANPKKGSAHNRGGAVDLTLVDATGKELEMPTGHDDFTERAYLEAPASRAAEANRAVLRSAMEAQGFKPIRTEWWHYDAPGSRSWPIVEAPLCPEPAPGDGGTP